MKAHNPDAVFLVWLVVITLVTVGCDRQATTQPTAKENVKPVEIMMVERTVVTDTYEYSGILRAFKEVKLSNEVSGVITEYRVDKGSRVEKGELLVCIDDDDYRRKVEEMEARLERAVAVRQNADKEYERKKSLFSNSVISESALDREYLNYQTAKADERLSTVLLEQAQDDYHKTKLYSPFDGIILEKYREVGELIPSGTILLQVADYSQVKLELGISEKDIVHVHKDASAQVRVDPFPDQIFSGTINYVGVNVESETGTFPVELVIQNPLFKLLPGMIARSSIAGEVHNGIILIPQNSLRKYFGDCTVFIERNGRALQRSVRLGKVYGERIEIIEGVSEGDHLITLGLSDLQSGEPVKARNKG